MGRLLLAITLLLTAGALSVNSTWRVAAQDSGAQVVVERPLQGTSISVQAAISGWAVDPTGPGTGVDAIHVYLDGEPGQARARFIGQASYGQPRADVARTLGEARFTNSGFALLTELPPGTHSLYVYAHTAGAGPQDGWSRGSVASFETSLIEAVATMVQPGPTPAGDTGRYQTGQASWQGGNTCVRYTGAGSCESSIPVGVASGASCIQWNQRGQCMNYAGGVDAAASSSGSSSSAPPAPSVRSVPPSGPPSVPTITSGGASRPPVGAPRAVAPPSDAASGDDGDAGAAPSNPPPAAAPAAAPPGGGDEALPAVRVAAPPPVAPAAAGAVRTSPATSSGATAAAPPPSGASRASGAISTPVIVLAPAAGNGAPGDPLDLAIPAEAPPPVADLPQVQLTAAALHTNANGPGVAPLRSGCALYVGCGGDSAASTTASAPVATRPPVITSPPSSLASQASPLGVTGNSATGSGIAGTGATGTGVTGNSATGSGIAGAGAIGTGIAGTSATGTGIAGTGIAGAGATGTGIAGTGIAGTSATGTGIAGTGVAGTGVTGNGVASNLVFTPTPTVTPTACPPFGGCGPGAR